MRVTDGLIYLVDDNESILELLKDILEGDNFKVMAFSDSQELLDQTYKETPDLFLLDIAMPGIDGINLCRMFKTREELDMVPVIFISGMIDIEDKVKGFAAGGADYITKPFIPIDVLSRVRTHVKLKKYIDQTRSFNTALEEGIRIRTRELQQAKEEAEKANREKTRFLSNINHELRTPLNGIMGMLEILQNKEIPDEEIASYIELTGYSARQLSRLINDILDFTQLNNRSMHFQYEPFSVNGMVRFLKQKYLPGCREKGLEFQIETPTEDVLFTGDESRILQIVENLISNSIKYSLKGKVSVRLLPGEELTIQVSDEGVGIPPESQDEIFKPYVQIDNSYIREKQGLGLGLAIIKDIITQMNGSIDLESDKNGTRFTVKIPSRGTTQAPPAVTQKSSDSGKGRILLAEDDAVSLFYTELTLSEAGFDVTTAIDGSEAASLIASCSYDLALLDISLPKLSGIDVMSRIKEKNPEIPVVAITAYCQEEDIRLFRESGFSEVITKPLNSQVLLQKVNQLFKP